MRPPKTSRPTPEVAAKLESAEPIEPIESTPEPELESTTVEAEATSEGTTHEGTAEDPIPLNEAAPPPSAPPGPEPVAPSTDAAQREEYRRTAAEVASLEGQQARSSQDRTPKQLDATIHRAKEAVADAKAAYLDAVRRGDPSDGAEAQIRGAQANYTQALAEHDAYFATTQSTENRLAAARVKLATLESALLKKFEV